MKRKVIWNNFQNQERKQFAFLESKIENFSARDLGKKNKTKRKTKKKERKKRHTHIEVTKTKRIASRDHALLMLLFFENRMYLHNEIDNSWRTK